MGEVVLFVCLLNYVNVLVILVSNGNYKLAAHSKLGYQLLRHLLSPRTYMDCVVRSTFSISVSSISANYQNVLVFELVLIRLVEVEYRGLREILDVLNTHNLSCFLRRICFYHFIEASTKNPCSRSNIKHF